VRLSERLLDLGVLFLFWSATIRAVYGNHEELCGVGKRV
jgi:hypothetical protein